MQKSKRVKQGFFLSMYPAMEIEGVQYWPGERLVGQKRTGLGETSGAEKDWPGRGQWGRKGLAWERPVGQERTGLGEVSGAKRTGLGETSGTGKDWPGRDQWGRKGLAWERSVEQERKPDNMSPGGTTLERPPARQETQRMEFSPWVGKVPGRRKRKDQEK